MLAVEANRLGADLAHLVTEIAARSGVLRVRRALGLDDLAAARAIVDGADTADDRPTRIWGLFGAAPVTTRIADHPALLPLVRAVVGDAARLAALSATQVPSDAAPGPAQLGYPYWDLYNREAFPSRLPPSATLGVGVLYLLDDMGSNAGVSVVAGPWDEIRHPVDDAAHDTEADPVRGVAGDAVVLHAGASRRLLGGGRCRMLLAEYVPGFVAPVEVFEAPADATPSVRRLLGERPRLDAPLLAPPSGAGPEPPRPPESEPPRVISRRSMLSLRREE